MSISTAGLPDPGLTANHPVGRSDTARNLKIYLALAGITVTRLWIMPMTSSLWLDESITYWSACKGASAAISRSQLWPGQNAVYSVIAALMLRWGGNSEVVFRLPSLLAALAAAWLLLRLGTRLFDQETGILAAVVFVSLQEMSKIAPNARPYAIALLLVVGSTLQLVRWLDSGRLRNLLGYVVLAAAIPYFHYLFAVVLPIQAFYALYRSRREQRIRLGLLVAAAGLVCVLLLPLISNAIHANRITTAASFLSTPSFEDFVVSLMPGVLAAGILAGLMLAYILSGNLRTDVQLQTPSDTALLVIAWFAIPLVVCFSVSRLSDFKIFVPRYYLCAFPALALLVAWGIRSLVPDKIRIWMAGSIVAAALLSFGSHHFWVHPYLEDWRAAAQNVRASGISQDTPVLVRTGLIESAKPPWKVDINPDNPLLAPLSRYPIPGRIIMVPSGLNQDSVRYMNDVSSQILMSSGRFLYLRRDVGDEFLPWLSGYFSSRGFVITKLGHADGVSVFEFRRP